MTTLEPLPPPPEFAPAAGALGIEFEPGDVESLGKFLAMLLEANRSFNLTAVTDPALAWSRHILDSLTLLSLLAELPEGSTVLDVGSGGGLPGVPLAIVLPRLRFTLLEATGKKAEFLRSAVAALRLDNAAVLQERAEVAGQDRGQRTDSGGRAERSGGHREAYDAVLARAVGPLAVVAELTIPFAKVGGRVLLIKGQRAAEELADAGPALEAMHATHVGTVETPTGRVVVLEKIRSTPRAYPRRDGEPKRSPLSVKKPT